MTISELTKLPASYREEIVSPIMQCLLAGESCAVVGIAGTGKSNLVRLLTRPDVHTIYLGDERDKFLFCFVDFNRLAQPSEWGFWELLLHRMADTLVEAKADPNLVTQLTDLHQRATTSRDEVVAQRYFEIGIGSLCAPPDRRVAFLFDQFDGVWKSLSGAPFLTLRALRDEFKYRLSFITATREELARLRETLEGCQDFYELVSLNTFGLGPHSEKDARNQIERFAIRRGRTLEEQEIRRLMEVSGRHPGILRAAYWAIVDGKVRVGEGLLEQLTHEAAVRKECQEIWESLGEDEQLTLKPLANGYSPSAGEKDVIDLLRLKGLVNRDIPRLTSPIFEQYIRWLTPSGPRRLRLDKDRSSGQVIRVVVEGKPVENELSKKELSLLSYLYERRGEVCDRAELTRVLYPNDARIEEGFLPDRRLDTIIRRLRDKIEPDRTDSRYILTIRDRGYKLAPDEIEETLS